jgi:hypothetical protein
VGSSNWKTVKKECENNISTTPWHEGTEKKTMCSSTTSLTLALDGGCGSCHACVALLPEMTRYAFYRRFGGPQICSIYNTCEGLYKGMVGLLFWNFCERKEDKHEGPQQFECRARFEAEISQTHGEIVTTQANLLGKTVRRFTYATHAIYILLVYFTQREYLCRS